MSESEIAAQLVAALTNIAKQAAGAEAPLLSMTMEVVVGQGAPANVTATISRKTRTLVFAIAEANAADGAPIATASSVHQIKA